MPRVRKHQQRRGKGLSSRRTPAAGSNRVQGGRVGRRGNMKWLHAGLLRDVQGNIKDVWYTFRPCNKNPCFNNRRCSGHHIDYAMDNIGTRFCNFHVGLRKIDMITWDPHHERRYYHLLSPEGTWIRGRAMAARKFRRLTLLRHWLNRNSVDLYPQGRAHEGFLGPNVNVVHSVQDTRINAIDYPVYLTNLQAIPGPWYPNTNIPLSADHIDMNLWKQDGREPLVIAIQFLNGVFASLDNFTHQRERYERLIESAFYAQGYRIHRASMAEANADLKRGSDNAYRTDAWRNNPPLRVDKFKGRLLKRNLRRMATLYGSDSDDSDDDDGSDDDRRGARQRRSHHRGRSRERRDQNGVDDSDDDDDDDNENRKSKRNKRKKNKHRIRDHKKNKRHPKRCHDDQENEDDDLFVRQPSTSSPLQNPKPEPEVSGEASGLRPPRSNILNAFVMRRLAAEERARKEASRELENLPDDSPLNGKDKATATTARERPLVIDLEDEIKEEDNVSDIEIDESRTTAKRARYTFEGNFCDMTFDTEDEDEDEDEGSAPRNITPSPVSDGRNNIPSPSAASRSPAQEGNTRINASPLREPTQSSTLGADDRQENDIRLPEVPSVLPCPTKKDLLDQQNPANTAASSVLNNVLSPSPADSIRGNETPQAAHKSAPLSPSSKNSNFQENEVDIASTPPNSAMLLDLSLETQKSRTESVIRSRPVSRAGSSTEMPVIIEIDDDTNDGDDNVEVIFIEELSAPRSIFGGGDGLKRESGLVGE